MPNFLHRSAALLMVFATALIPKAGALTGISAWAQEGVSAAEANGLVSESLQELDATGEITRAEFCSIAVNAYKTVSGKTVFVSPKRPFRDCDDPSVVAAYELGLVSGSGDGYFKPDNSIKRQDLCVVLYNILDAVKIEAPNLGAGAKLEDFPDSEGVSNYAEQAMSVMVNCAIVNGVSNCGVTMLDPEGVATREQALIISDRFCNMFAENLCGGTEISYGAVGNNNRIASANISSSGNLDENSKRLLVYGGGENYESSEEAESHMVEIAVKVWRLQPDGSKTTGTAYLTVNENLASIYKQIFDEIYNGSERFPIYDVGCYSWRTGEHSQGTAVDINPEENMEATINSDGSLTPTCGTHWSPGIDPYSIPEGGDVYNAFIRHGFTWGGNAWHSKRDYMHFSYFGR